MGFSLGEKEHALEIKGALMCDQYEASNISRVRAMVRMNGFTFLSSSPAGVSIDLTVEWLRWQTVPAASC